MPHETALIVTIAAAFGLALVLGLVAVRLRMPALVGYLVAGIVVGPYSPGFVADMGLAQQLSEIGVILLMFGVGIHFSLDDLLAVRRIAVPGAVVQIAVATVLGAAISQLWGWSWGSGIVFGLCLSGASTVVLLRALSLLLQDAFSVLFFVAVGIRSTRLARNHLSMAWDARNPVALSQSGREDLVSMFWRRSAAA